MKSLATLCACTAVLAFAGTLSAQVFISEYCADPYNTVTFGIDPNLDGIAATTAAQSDDEFVEIVNLSPNNVAVDNWTLSDLVGVRYTFPPGSVLPPFSAVVIFGGGNLANFNSLGFGTGVVANNVALTALGLNNSGTETITLRDAASVIIDQKTYSGGAANADYGDGESVVRNPETAGSPFAKISTVTPALRHTAGLQNDGVTNYLPALIPTVGPSYPGNGSEMDIRVLFSGIPNNTLTKVHTCQAGTTLSLRFYASSGTSNVIGQPFIVAGEVFATGSPAVPITLPGDAAGSVWMNPVSAFVILDGFATFGQTFSPVMTLESAAYTINTIVPVSLGGLGASIMVQCYATDTGRNAVNLGSTDARELIVP